MAKYTFKYDGPWGWEGTWTDQEKKEIKEISDQFKKEFCMTEKKVEWKAIEKPKVFCINCEHSLNCRIGGSETNILSLCALEELEKVKDYVTGKMVYDFASVKNMDQYSEFYYSSIVEAKKILGFTYKKEVVTKLPLRYARKCKHINKRGDCPTYHEKEEVVGQEEGKE